MHARVEWSNRRQNDCNNTQNRQYTSNRQKLPNLPVGTKNWRISEADGSENHADGSTMGTDTQSIKTDVKTAKNASKTVKKHQRRPAMQNSPLKLETEMTKLPEGRKRVSIKGKNVHALQNTPIEALDART